MNATYPAALPAIETLDADQLYNELSLEENAAAMRFETWWLNEGAKLRNGSPLALAQAAYSNATVNAAAPIVLTKEVPAAGLFGLFALGVVAGMAISITTAIIIF